MLKGEVRDAIRKVQKQLKLGTCETWGPKLKFIYQEKPFIEPNFADLPPIEAVEPFRLPKFQFDDEKLMQMPPPVYTESVFAPGTNLRPLKASSIKGVNNELYTLGYLYKVPAYKAQYQCKWFSIVYFHRHHYFSKIAKSSPSLLVTVNNNNMFNQSTIINRNDVSARFHNCAFPYKYATSRTKVKKLIREVMFEVYEASESHYEQFGGFYKFSVNLCPHSTEDLAHFDSCIREGLKTVFGLPESELMKGVKNSDPRICWNTVNKVFKRFNMKPVGPYYKSTLKREPPTQR